MSLAAHAHAPYGVFAQAVRTPRDIEYGVLARVTGQLQAHLPQPEGVVTPSLARALADNQRLWTVFAADLAHPDNAFPSDLRARLFYLAEFTLHHTARVLAGTAQAQALVDINTAVMRGLRGIEVEG